MVQSLVENPPRPSYLLAVDSSHNTMEDIVKVSRNATCLRVQQNRGSVMFPAGPEMISWSRNDLLFPWLLDQLYVLKLGI